MANKDSTKRTLSVALILCVVCSIIVSTAAVMLRPAQKANKADDIKSNILAAAGMLDAKKTLEAQFSQIEPKLLDIETGKFASEADINLETYDQFKASKDPALSEELSREADIAGLNRLEKYAKVYLVKDGDAIDKVILPIRGYGLWSTLKGFIALESDLSTVAGIGYYDHKETPGLGGEVDNPRWKQLWIGKEVYNEQGEVALSMIKGNVSADTPDAEHKVDGLSGATLTSRGVDNMIKFWLGDNGYKPFLANLKKGEV